MNVIVLIPDKENSSKYKMQEFTNEKEAIEFVKSLECKICDLKIYRACEVLNVITNFLEGKEHD